MQSIITPGTAAAIQTDHGLAHGTVVTVSRDISNGAIVAVVRIGELPPVGTTAPASQANAQEVQA